MAQLMLVRLADHTDEKTGYTFVSLTTVGVEMGLKFRQAWNVRQKLIRSGELRVVPVKGRSDRQYVMTQQIGRAHV